jgi:uncharacterized membrane protein YphA (DoxX/SURF4 family)
MLMATAKTKNLVVMILSVLLALAFLSAGGTKLVSSDEAALDFEEVGYPGWFAAVTGVLEVAGAVLIIIPAARFYGATLLVCVMAGAIFTHAGAGQFGMLLPPVMLLMLASIVAWARCPCGKTRAASSRVESMIL